MTQATQGLSDISRESLDRSDEISYAIQSAPGLSIEVIRAISTTNNEPTWMLEKRLEAFEVFQSRSFPTWGPSLAELHLEELYYFAKPKGSSEAQNWEDVPDTIKATFDRLGIPQAEREILAGVGAQYDSSVIYHNLHQELQDQGVVFMDMSQALHEHEAIIREHFMRAIPIGDHKFSALHTAVWSGGTFLYVPAGVHISDPLQAYFRMNLRAGGQFEHTIIILEEDSSVHYIEGCSAPKYNTPSLHAGCVEIYVGKKAKMRYSSVENWSINTYNLNTKRAIIEEKGTIEWVGGNLGSGVTMLYPCSVLKGDFSNSLNFGVAFAGDKQVVETGAKVIHIGKNTTSEVISKQLSKGSGVCSYRGLVDVKKSAKNATSKIDCDGLILNPESSSYTIPDIRVATGDAVVAHEASVGKINEETLFYLQSRGMQEDDARTMIVQGFISPLVKELPLEYAAEMNTLIAMEMEGM